LLPDDAMEARHGIGELLLEEKTKARILRK
jgi:hypothetical protein